MTQRIVISTLGGVKYPEVIAAIPKKFGTKYFWREFGKAREQIKKDAKSGREAIAVQGLWAGSSHNYTDAHRSDAIKIGKAYQAIAIQFPNCEFSYSPFCEHKKSKDYMTKLLNELRVVCPNLRLVNSPIAGGDWVKGFVNEIHPNSKPPGMPEGEFDFDYDGVHCFDADVEMYKKLYAKARNFAYWFFQLNCHANKDDESRDARPTKELVESAIFNAVNTKKKVSLEKGYIGKSHSQQNNKPTDARGNKVVIVGPKGKKLKSVKLDNISLTDGGMTEDRRNTWRSTLWGYKQRRPMRVIVDGESVGTIDPGFRENEPRNKAT